MLVAAVALWGVTASQAVEDQVVIKPGPEGIDKYFGTFYNKDGVNGNLLRVGGWSDYYYSLIRFPAATQSLPWAIKRAELKLYALNCTRPTAMQVWLLASAWTEASWDHANLMGYYLHDSPGPNIGSGWYSLDVTDCVYYWRQGYVPNLGWLFAPTAVDNRFDEFASSDHTTASLRPELHLVCDLNFKMPLPGGKAWKMTVEAGGKANDNIDDPFHKGATYYSLDFAPQSVQVGGIGPVYRETDVPILAMEGGRVYGVWRNNPDNNPNGYSVRIDHGCDIDTKSGFQTVYCHFKQAPLVQEGQIVVQGQKLGIMGNTGRDSQGKSTSTGVHSHITFYYMGTANGNGTDSFLDQIRLEGRALKDYKLNQYNPAQPIFYPSSNMTK